MLISAFFRWWYGAGWQQLRQGVPARIHHTYLGYSVPTLTRTLFAPWRRIISSSGNTLGDHLRALVDNTVSRFVGFIVRIIALAAAGVIIMIDIIIGGSLIVLWPILPILGPTLILIGLFR